MEARASTIAGLAPGTTYHVRLVVTTPDGSAATADATFTTKVPSSPAASSTPAECKVPKLRLLSLAKAKKALAEAHCALGTVRRPKRHRSGARSHKLVVVSQKPATGASLQAGAKVKVKLGVPPKRHPKHVH